MLNTDKTVLPCLRTLKGPLGQACGQLSANTPRPMLCRKQEYQESLQRAHFHSGQHCNLLLNLSGSGEGKYPPHHH